MKVGIKNRYGRKDSHIWTSFMHTDSGVEPQFKNRLCDEKWCSSHGLIASTRGEMLMEKEPGNTVQSIKQNEVELQKTHWLKWLIYGNNRG